MDLAVQATRVLKKITLASSSLDSKLKEMKAITTFLLKHQRELLKKSHCSLILGPSIPRLTRCIMQIN